MDRNLRAFFVIAGPLAPSRFALRRTRRRGRPSGVEGVLDLAIGIEIVLRRLRHYQYSFSPRR